MPSIRWLGLLAVVAGVRLGTVSSAGPLLWACLLASGLALRGRVGILVAAVACGALRVVAAPLPTHGPSGPVRVVAEWKDDIEDRDPIVDVRRVVEGREVRERVRLDLPEDLRQRLGDGALLRVRGTQRRTAVAANRPTARSTWPPTLAVKSARLVELLRHGEPRRDFRRTVGTLLENARSEGILRALVLGDSSRLDERHKRLFRRFGSLHVLAVSGLHVGLVAVLLLPLGRVVAGDRGDLVPALGVAAYLVLVGFRPSALRAGSMVGLLLLARTLGRATPARDALITACHVLILLDPSLVDDIGFRLSVLATAGILELAPRWAHRWTALPARLRLPLAVGIAAQISIVPVLGPWTGRVQPEGLLTHVFALPWLVGTLVLSTGALLAELLAGVGPWSVVDAWVLGPLDRLLLLPPGPIHPAGTPTPLAAIAWAGLLVAVAEKPKSLGLPLLLAGLFCHARPSAESPSFEMLDVGQGESLLLRGNGEAVLVDAGGWRFGDIADRVLLPALADRGVRRLRALVLTHGDLDHCGGALQLVGEMRVEEVWASPSTARSTCGARVLRSPGVRWRPVWAGDRTNAAGWTFHVLWPEPTSRDSGNDGSLVLRARPGDGGPTFLLTGDIGEDVERRLVRTRRDVVHSDVLKIAHHGSASSTSGRFLEAVAPRLALSSAGRPSPFGHPSRVVLGRLGARGVPHLSTASSGAVRLDLPTGESGFRIETPWSPPPGRP